MRKRNEMDQSGKGDLEYVMIKNTYALNNTASKCIRPEFWREMEPKSELKCTTVESIVWRQGWQNVYSVEEEIKQARACTLEICINVLSQNLKGKAVNRKVSDPGRKCELAVKPHLHKILIYI